MTPSRPDLFGLVSEPPKRDHAFPRCEHAGGPHEGNFGFRLSATRMLHLCRAHPGEGERRLPQNAGRSVA